MSNLTTKEAAEFIRKCPTTIRRMVQDGRLRGFRTHRNGHLLFREADLLRAIGHEGDPMSDQKPDTKIAKFGSDQKPDTKIAKFGSESGHWYTQHGELVERVQMANGKDWTTPTLRHARKLGLVCGVTTIIKQLHAEQLVRWRINQHLLAALTLDRQPDETDASYMARVANDANTHGREAAKTGTEIHKAIEMNMRGEAYDPRYQPHVDGVVASLDANCGPDAAWLPERGVVHPWGYATKADLVSEKLQFLVDLKGKDFGPHNRPMNTYEGHAMQLGATRACIAPELRCAILYVSRDHPGLTSFVEIPEPGLKRGLAMFRGQLACWQAKTGHLPEWAEGAI